MRSAKPRFRTRRAVLLAGLCLVAGFGCGSRKGDVSGKVTYQGRAIVIGSVLMTAREGPPVVAALDDEGHYSLKGVPAGPVNVAVITTLPVYLKGPPGFRPGILAARDKKKPEGDKPPAIDTTPPGIDLAKWIDLPSKYQKADSSEITTTIQVGSNTFDIDIP